MKICYRGYNYMKKNILVFISFLMVIIFYYTLSLIIYNFQLSAYIWKQDTDTDFNTGFFSNISIKGTGIDAYCVITVQIKK